MWDGETWEKGAQVRPQNRDNYPACRVALEMFIAKVRSIDKTWNTKSMSVLLNY